MAAEVRNEQGVVRRRMEVVFLCFLVAVAVQVARLAYLQWWKARDFARLANRIQIVNIHVDAFRGRILDRNGNVLAQDVLAQAVCVNPRVVSDAAATARRIAAVLELPASEVERIRARIELGMERRRFYARVVRGVDRRRAQKLVELERSDPALKGLWLEPVPVRVQPGGVDALQLVGTVGHDGRGGQGIERQFDSILRGREGTRRVRVSATGTPIPESETRVVEPVNGRDVRLTIDRDIQHFVEGEVNRVATVQKPDAVTAIVMDVRNGDVLGMASWPSPIPGKTPTPAQMRNRAVSDLFEPGSIFKVITAAAALEYGVPTSATCTGSLTIGKRAIRCAHGAVHGSVPLRKMVEQSCNIAAATLARRVGAERFHAYLRQMGFDQPTGIEFPGESPVRLRSPERWAPMTTANIGFGQGIAINPLQLLAGYAAIANDGVYVPPRLLLSPEDAGEAAKRRMEPRRVLSSANAAVLRSHMEAVVTSGTGKKAKIAAYSVAGKTGTAEIARGGRYGHGYVASFAGFVPAHRPRLAILVSVWRPRVEQYGGSVSAPVFREIARQSVAYLGIPPDAPNDQRDGADDGRIRRVARRAGDSPRD